MTITLPYASLINFYSEIEGLSNFGGYEISRNIKLLLDSNQDPDNQNRLKFELLAFEFILRGGTVKPVHTITTKDGTSIWGYPSMIDLGEDGLKYIEWRLSQTKNKWLHIRYGQILLSSNIQLPKGKLFTTTIDCYFALLSECNATDTLITDKGKIVVSIIENLFPLTIKTSYRVADVSGETVNLLEVAEFPLFNKIRLLRLVLSHRKKFWRFRCK